MVELSNVYLNAGVGTRRKLASFLHTRKYHNRISCALNRWTRPVNYVDDLGFTDGRTGPQHGRISYSFWTHPLKVKVDTSSLNCVCVRQKYGRIKRVNCVHQIYMYGRTQRGNLHCMCNRYCIYKLLPEIM